MLNWFVGNACGCAHTAGFYEHSQRQVGGSHQFYIPIIGNGLGEKVPHVYLHITFVESLHGAIPAVMEQDHKSHDFADAEFWFLFGWITQNVRSKSVMEVKTKGINLAEDFGNFIVG